MIDESNVPRITHIKTYVLLLAAFWTAVIVISMMATYAGERKEVFAIARNVANAYIDKDILFRDWVARHGGIYVPITGETPPNTLIPEGIIAEREISTPSGKRLTFVNPAYLTRQLYEFSRTQKGITVRITSSRPVSPLNTPDEWETRALQAFEHGHREFSSVVADNRGTGYFRLMRPLMTEEPCLACHRHQGYKNGEVRGGIGVKLPMSLFEGAMHQHLDVAWTAHGIMWLLGLAGLNAGYRGIRRRTTERDQAEEELRLVNAILQSQATVDFLTGIPNRRKLLDLLGAEIREAARYGTPLVLVFFDVDRFKHINDTFGHDAGDQVLVELARLVGSTIRNTDIFARYGGEEFVVLLPNCDLQAGRALAEKIRGLVEANDFAVVHSLTCSFGVAGFERGDTLDSLIAKGDEAMYAAKKRGRNRVECWSKPAA